MFRHEGRVLYVTSKVTAEHEDMGAWADIVASLGNGAAPFVVWDARHTKSIRSGERRRAITDLESAVAAVAVVAGSPVPHEVVDLFVTVQRLRVPTALFESEAEAVAWVSSLDEAVS